MVIRVSARTSTVDGPIVPRQGRLIFAGLFIGIVAMFAPALAQEPSASPATTVISPVADAAATKMRATITLGVRKVSFAGDLEPLARRAVAFDAATADVTDSARLGVAELKDALAEARGKKGLAASSPIVVIAYGQDAERAYRRARAVRGELIERHQADPAAIVAAGRQAPGHTEGTTVVDIYAIDPATCAGCGETPFSTIARDSGAMKLVTALLEAAPAARQAAGAAPAPRVAPRRIAAPLATAPRIAPAPVSTPSPSALAPASPQPDAAVKPAPRRIQVSAAGCPRPRIIIDDYYPGGPIVPCRIPRR
jgi:hypothetical protein